MGMGFHSAARRRPDPNVMFVVNYVDGRSAYLWVAPQQIRAGDFMARSIAAECQESGGIPAGPIIAVRRVR